MAKVREAHSLERSQVRDVEIISIAGGGAGVAKVDGVPIFVDRAVVGDKLKIRLYDVRKDFAKAEIVNVISAGPGRTEAPCQHFERCGGCQWQEMTYAEQLRSKESILREALMHLGGGKVFTRERLAEIFSPILPCEDPWRYRNKAQFPLQFKMGKTLAGYYESGSHELVNIESCLIQPESMDRVLHLVRDLVRQHKISIYDETKHKGLLRHLNVKMSFAQKRLLVTFVVNHVPQKYKDFAQNEYLQVFTRIAQQLMEAAPEVESVALNFNDERGNRIMGDTTLNVLGRGYIEEVLATERKDLPDLLQDGLTFRLSSESFFQVNSRQAVHLLEIVYDFAKSVLVEKPEQDNVIFDAYAGVGSIAMWLSPLAGTVFAVEENEEAVADGIKNAEINKVSNLSFHAGRVEDALETLMGGVDEIDLLVVDPPRKGVDARVLNSIRERGPKNIIYVSCNPATLARDLRILEGHGEFQGKFEQVSGTNGEAGQSDAESESNKQSEPAIKYGYKTIRISPLDLFPQTYHVETVALLTRN